jgi:23S rRNA pseudouridine1911/1915/1917 synthase
VGLGFAHPASGEWLEVASAYPEDLAAALATLRAAYGDDRSAEGVGGGDLD